MSACHPKSGPGSRPWLPRWLGRDDSGDGKEGVDGSGCRRSPPFHSIPSLPFPSPSSPSPLHLPPLCPFHRVRVRLTKRRVSMVGLGSLETVWMAWMAHMQFRYHPHSGSPHASSRLVVPLAQGGRTALVCGLSNPAPTCSQPQWPLLSGYAACRGVHDRSRSRLAPPSPGAWHCSFRSLPRVLHLRVALDIRTQRASGIDGHACQFSHPTEACAATQDGSQTLDGQEHAVAWEAGGVAPRMSTQPSALRLPTVRPLRRLTAPPNIARRSSRSHMTQPQQIWTQQLLESSTSQ
ncbi:hypothetical protein BJV77DRAFT_966086 [Russula vinacea]|nr:hypothetical protein BJV77DRAFT_966086 [Russula vinacea]